MNYKKKKNNKNNNKTNQEEQLTTKNWIILQIANIIRILTN